ncbi:hypothetical protein KL86CLO1_10484 [uncultured Eubacteriales bacterium]|uniref:Uncharacterized protein n=1 Tax=uncultured Eubacteriales bacterium TaxID=172733 RepID=A0A212J435_9FIRM|nr:hypothetical protein KL86CLO1_10484 [uncultured Eubacteriales bacterium]
MSKHLDWSRITPDVAVWCKTEEEELAFLLACEERGITWISGKKPTNELFFNEAGANHYEVENNRISLADTQTATTIPYSDLLVEDEPARSRLAEILGVEEDEEWTIRPELVWDGDAVYRIHNGRRQYRSNDDIWRDCAAEADFWYIINHPESIIRKPRFTADEVAMLRVMASDGVTKLSRAMGGALTWEREGASMTGYLPPNILPTILYGESVELAEVLK